MIVTAPLGQRLGVGGLTFHIVPYALFLEQNIESNRLCVGIDDDGLLCLQKRLRFVKSISIAAVAKSEFFNLSVRQYSRK